MNQDEDYFTYTQQIAHELHQKDELIFRTPNKFWQEDKAFFLFSQQSYFRRFWQFIGTHFIFQTTIIAAILLNCVQLAAAQYLPNGDRAANADFLDGTEPWFLLIFVIECVVQILANGFILHKGSYMRSGWNIMDFTVVCTGILEMYGEALFALLNMDSSILSKMKLLKMGRVFRPLKLISNSPSLQVVMSAILKAIPPIGNILVLLVFFIVFFAIIGLDFYAGAFHSACYDLAGDVALDGQVCKMNLTWGDNDTEWVAQSPFICPPETYCGVDPIGPNNGITQFDSIVPAMMTVFQILTMEGWTELMYMTNDASNSSKGMNTAVFITMVVMGSMFMLNLVIGVLSGEFSKERENVENRKNFLLLREETSIERDLDGYMDWVKRGEYVAEMEKYGDEGGERREAKIIPKRRHTTVPNGFDIPGYCQVDDEEDAVFYDDVDDDEGNERTKPFKMQLAEAELMLRVRLKTLVRSEFWFWGVLLLVFVNTALRCTIHYGMPDWWEETLFKAEVSFLIIFSLETLLKMYGLSPMIFFRSKFNTFDLIVVIVSIVDFTASQLVPGFSMGISVLRALRLLRIFKVTSYAADLANLVASLVNSLNSILALIFLLFLILGVFALLGMQLFGGKFAVDFEPTPQQNFDTFVPAFLTVFQILTGEDWPSLMYHCVEAMGGVNGGGIIYSVYYIILVVVGNFILLNVFLAIAVDNLANAAELGEEEEEEETDESASIKSVKDEEAKVAEIKESPSSFGIFDHNDPIRVSCRVINDHPIFVNFILIIIGLSSIALALDDPISVNPQLVSILWHMDIIFTSFFIMETIIKLIALGLIFHPGSFLRSIWNILDIIVVGGAILDLVLVGDAPGRDCENELTIALMPNCGALEGEKVNVGTDVGFIKTLRVFRVLRPLKSIQRIPKLKAVFNGFITSLVNVVPILLIYGLLMLIFAVIGVELFNGKFNFCSDASRMTMDTCVGDMIIPHSDHHELVPREWLQHDFHFDNLPSALLTLFIYSTGAGWPGGMWAAIETTAPGRGPEPGARFDFAIYFLTFIIVFPFFFVNVFIAFVILTFQGEGDAQIELECDLPKNDQVCLDFAINSKPINKYMPKNKNSFQYKIWLIVTNPYFDNFILGLIVLNTVTLMMKNFEMTPEYERVLLITNVIFTTLFSFEAFIKLYGFGPVNYYSDAWNMFDFVTVIGSLIDIGLSLKQEDIEVELNLSFLRLFRAARLIKLLRQFETIRILIWSFIQSVKALPYVCFLIFLLFFIYSIVGIQMFGTISIDGDGEITLQNNFRNFPNAMMLLFRASGAGEGWQDIMLSCQTGADCDPAVIVPGSDKKCGSVVAIPYFISFIFLCSFLMLNLFVAVIMDNFEFLTRDSSILGPHHLDKFSSAWSDFDPHATGSMIATDLPKLLTQLEPPVALGKNAPKRLIYKRLIEMNVPIDDEGRVTFKHIIVGLIRTGLYTKKITKEESKKVTFERQKELDREMRIEMGRKWKLSDDMLNVYVADPDTSYPGSTGRMFGALLMFDHWKVYNERKKGIQEAKAQIEQQKHIASQLEKLKQLEHEINKSTTDTLPPLRAGLLSTIGSAMAVPILRQRTTPPIPKPRRSSSASTRQLLSTSVESRIESTAFTNPSFANEDNTDGDDSHPVDDLPL